MWVELVHVDDGSGTLLETYREPPDGQDAVAGTRTAPADRLGDWSRLLAGSSGPLVVDPDTGVPVALDHGDSPHMLVLVVPTLSSGVWMLLVGCGGPVTDDDAPRARRAGQAIGWVVDRVTSQRQIDELASERDLLAAAVDVASPGLLVAGPDLVIRVANRGAAVAFGAEGDDLASRSVSELFAGATVDRIRETLERLVVEGGSWQGRFEGRTRFDRDARLYLRADAVVRPDGTPFGLIVAVWDLELQAEPLDD